MRRDRYVLSYDTRDPANDRVRSILSSLGYRRSEVIRELLEDIAARYGTDVLQKDNAGVLIYLIRNHVGEKGADASGRDRVIALAAVPEPERKPRRMKRKQAVSKVDEAMAPEQAAEAKPDPAAQEAAAQKAVDWLRERDAAAGSTEAADEKRARVLEYLENGFYQEEG